MSTKARKTNYSNTSPRGYLSWSQLNLWEKDPNMYYQVYFEGLDQFRTKYLELGKRMATTLENGFDEFGDPMFDMLSVMLPAYPEREFEIKVNHKVSDKLVVPLLGKLDGWNKATMTIGEYKTGKHWTQSLVDSSGQLTFYALLVWLKYKTMPKHIILHWAKTQEDEFGNLELTGDIKSFKTQRSLKDLILLSGRIERAWKGICELGEFNKQERPAQF